MKIKDFQGFRASGDVVSELRVTVFSHKNRYFTFSRDRLFLFSLVNDSKYFEEVSREQFEYTTSPGAVRVHNLEPLRIPYR